MGAVSLFSSQGFRDWLVIFSFVGAPLFMAFLILLSILCVVGLLLHNSSEATKKKRQEQELDQDEKDRQAKQ